MDKKQLLNLLCCPWFIPHISGTNPAVEPAIKLILVECELSKYSNLWESYGKNPSKIKERTSC